MEATSGRSDSGGPHGRQPPLVDAGRHRARPADGRPRHDHREHRPAVRPGRPEHVGREPAVGHHRLHPRLRRAVAARRPGRRPRRPPDDLHDRAARLRGRLRARRGRCGTGDALRGPGPAGRVRRTARALRAVPAHHDVHRSEGPGEGLRRVRGDRRSGRGDRAARGRPAHPVPGLALVPVRERTGRPDRVRSTRRRCSPPDNGTPTPVSTCRAHCSARPGCCRWCTASPRRRRGAGATAWW